MNLPHRDFGPLCLAVLSVLAIAGDVRGEPSDLPTIDISPTTTQATTRPEAPDWLGLTEEQRGWWRVSRQRPTRMVEDTFYLVLSKAAELETLSPEGFRELDRPSYKSLLTAPERFTQPPAQPFRMRVRISEVFALRPDDGTAPFSMYWPRDRTFWRLHCLYSETDRPDLKPLIVYSTADPMPRLPESKNKAGDRPGLIADYKARPPYHGLPELELAGFLYKVHWSENKKGEEQDYPVLLAWQFREQTESAGSGWEKYLVILLILVVAGGLVWYLKRAAKRTSPGLSRAGYRPLRDGPEDDFELEREDEGPVDPDLAAAVEEYRAKRKGGADGAAGQR